MKRVELNNVCFACTGRSQEDKIEECQVCGGKLVEKKMEYENYDTRDALQRIKDNLNIKRR